LTDDKSIEIFLSPISSAIENVKETTEIFLFLFNMSTSYVWQLDSSAYFGAIF